MWVEVAGGADPQAVGARSAKPRAAPCPLVFSRICISTLREAAQEKLGQRCPLSSGARSTGMGRTAGEPDRPGRCGYLLEAIAKTAPTSANRTQKHPFVTVQWTIECGLLEVNPAGRMPKRAKESAKDRVLAPDEIRSRWPGRLMANFP